MLTMAGFEVEDVAPGRAAVHERRRRRDRAASRRIRTPIGCACARSTSARGARCRSSAARRTRGRHARAVRARRRDAARRAGDPRARRCAASRSQGMLCSARELGLSDDASGLLALPADAVAGHATCATRSRSTTRCSRSSSRRTVPTACRSSASRARSPRSPARRSHCRRSRRRRSTQHRDARRAHRGRRRVPALRGAHHRRHRPAGADAAWMRRGSSAAAMRSISAVVDISNYVMLELGQPLHIYDNRLLDGDIVVRLARAGRDADAAERRDARARAPTCCSSATSAKPLGLAGIMGGEHSGIADDTTNVYLEGAFWSPAVIQGSCAGSASRATPATASSAASISSSARAPSSARRS